jgi:hypothetical protein
LGEGKGLKSWRPAEKNVNRKPQEIRGWGNPPPQPQNAPETWKVRDSQDSWGGTFDEMPDNRETELIEPTSSRKTDHQVRDEVAIPQSQFWPIIVSVWKNCRDGNGEEPGEKKFQW